MKLVLPIMCAVALFLALTFVGWSLREREHHASASRQELCAAIQQTNRASRTLWLRVIARSQNPDPEQVEQFKKDLFELFPQHHC